MSRKVWLEFIFYGFGGIVGGFMLGGLAEEIDWQIRHGDDDKL